eukprot:4724200-Prymnesium_polylepis.1
MFDTKLASKEEIKINLTLVDVDQVDGKLSKEEFVNYHLKKFAAVEEGAFTVLINALMEKAEDAVVIDDTPAEARSIATPSPPARPSCNSQCRSFRRARAVVAHLWDFLAQISTRFNTLIIKGDAAYPAEPSCKIAVVQFK